MVAPGGGVRGCLGGHVWLLGGVCMVAPGVCVVARGACMVAPRGHVWQKGGVCGERGCAWYAPPPEIRLVIARVVRILLECILVFTNTRMHSSRMRTVRYSGRLMGVSA